MMITFCGAAQEVTGSKHIVECCGKRILLDCGMHQGKRKETTLLNSSFAFDPKTIDAVILSHAHIDHSGMLPLLVKRGFAGPIYSTEATKDVSYFMLMNLAGLQESDYLYMKKHDIRGVKRYAAPTITLADIAPMMARFETLPYVRQQSGWHGIFPGIKIKLYDAGHILGSAVLVMECIENGKKTTLAFTGDLGRYNMPILFDPQLIRDTVDAVISESTYGGHIHRPLAEAETAIVEYVHEIVRKKGKLIVPAFALGRTQELVYLLHRLIHQGRIPRIPVYVDSPLASEVTGVFKKYANDYDAESGADFPDDTDAPLFFKNLTYTDSKQQSQRLNGQKGPMIIIAASGMAEGGRILHHLKNELRHRENIILFTGYQAANTLGRKILDKQSPVNIFGKPYKVKARIEVVNELSAHADTNELTEYISQIHGLKKIFLVHGELDRMQALQNQLAGVLPNVSVTFPKPGEQVVV